MNPPVGSGATKGVLSEGYPLVESGATEGVLSRGYMLAGFVRWLPFVDQVLHQQSECPKPSLQKMAEKHGGEFRAFYTASDDRISLPEASGMCSPTGPILFEQLTAPVVFDLVVDNPIITAMAATCRSAAAVKTNQFYIAVL